jgi:hypothetical protein
VCGGSKSASSRSVAMVVPLLRSAAPIAAFTAITRRRAVSGLHRGRLATTAGAQRRTAGGGYFVSRCNAGKPAPTRIDAWREFRRRKIDAVRRCGPGPFAVRFAVWKARGRGSFREGRIIADRDAIDRSESELGVIVRTRTRPSNSGIGAHLPGQAGGARPREDDRRQGGGGLH